MNYWDKIKFFEKLLLFTWLAFLFSCLLFLSFTSHASSEQDYFPMSQNKNNKFTETDISNIESTFDSVNNFIIARYHHTNSSGTKYVRVLYFPKDNSVMIYGEIFNNLHQFSVYKVGTGNVKSQDITLSGNTLNKQGSAGTNYFNDFTSVESSNYSSDYDYVSNFQLYSNNNPDTRKIVLLYGSKEPVIPEDDTIPEDSEKPNLNDYLLEDTTPPSFDSSSVESALGSIFSYLQFETNKISGTISGIGQYLSDSIMWGLQMVINNIRSKIQEMITAIGDKIDEVKVAIGSKVEDIQDSIDYITQPVDGDIIYDSISTTSLVSNFNTIKTSITTFQTSFDNLSEPNEYKIPIHLENLNMPIFGNLTVQYIDLSVINPVKSIIRLMVTALVTYSLVITIFDSISNYINGGGDE